MFHRFALGVMALLLAAGLGWAQPQMQGDAFGDLAQARLIRVKRMADSWKNASVQLGFYSGEKQDGQFITMDRDKFRLKTRAGFRDIPVMSVKSVTLRRKPGDLLFVGLTTAGVSWLFAGGASLGFDSSRREVVTAAALGAVVGLIVGWKTFFQDEVVPLD